MICAVLLSEKPAKRGDSLGFSLPNRESKPFFNNLPGITPSVGASMSCPVSADCIPAKPPEFVASLSKL
jgi:hypothetical protein